MINFQSPTILVMLGITALLAATTLGLAIASRVRPMLNLTELNQRVRSWWLMAGIFFSAVLLSPNVSIIFLALVSFLALKEYLSLIETRRADRRVLLLAYLAIPAQYFLVAQGSYGFFIIFIPVFMFLILPVRMVLIGETPRFLSAVGSIQWGLMTCVFSLSHAAYLLVLPIDDQPKPENIIANGPAMLLCLVVLTQLNDVAQFVWGRALGGPKIIPKVSPGKTWSGFLGGVLTTTVLAFFLAPLLTPLSHTTALLAGALIAVSGFLGDVTISAVKRDIGIKDTGSLLPGHGGILDRVDSLTFTAPLFLHLVKYACFPTTL
jgi:phosphatidate cytidylyltransferase